MPNRYRYLRSIRTYEDLAEAIFLGVTAWEVKKVATYRRGKTWNDLKKASAMGALRGAMSFQKTRAEMAKAIEPIVIMKSDTWLRRIWRRLRST